MPFFLKRTSAQPAVNLELSTLLHYHTKFMFLWFVFRLFSLQVWVGVWMVDFNDKYIDEASNDSTNQRAHYRNPPEVIPSSEIRQGISETSLGLPPAITACYSPTSIIFLMLRLPLHTATGKGTHSPQLGSLGFPVHLTSDDALHCPISTQ